MRLNLGCGHNKRPGWINVDKFAACKPDQIVDLESLPWPWPDDEAEEVLLNHVLEHLGAAPDVYIGIMKELWRVCRNGAAVTIVVPHPRHDDFLIDPTHVRPITAQGLQMFSRKMNEEWARVGAANTPLALYHGIDFDFVSAEMRLEEPWGSDFEKGKIDHKTISEAVRRFNNIVKEQKFVLRTVK